jgi:hypothetical protein
MEENRPFCALMARGGASFMLHLSLRPFRAARLCGAVTLLSTAPAAAQPIDPQSFGAAQAVFDSAQKLMEDRRYGEACPKLEEVVRLVPSGVGAKVQLARCYEEAGRLASAWAAYLMAENAASVAGQAPRARAAGERAAALRPRLSTLAIVVPDALRALAGLGVKRNGNVVAEAEWGVAVPLDGGTYTITATAPARMPWKGEEQLNSEGARPRSPSRESSKLRPKRLRLPHRSRRGASPCPRPRRRPQRRRLSRQPRRSRRWRPEEACPRGPGPSAAQGSCSRA